MQVLWSERCSIFLLLFEVLDGDCLYLVLFLLPRVSFLSTMTLVLLDVPDTRGRLLYVKFETNQPRAMQTVQVSPIHNSQFTVCASVPVIS